MLKEKIREADEEQTLRQCKWRNLFFDKNGRSYRGIILEPTQAEAEQRAQRLLAEFAAHDHSKSNLYANTLDGELFAKAYAWHMQMPEGV